MTLALAHRGLTLHAPENTLPAFEAALALGADGAELDVQLTRDGIPVVCHDATVDRMTGQSGRIGSMTLAELKTLNFCGTHPEAGFVPIPTLEEYFAFVGDKPVVTNVEVKGDAASFMALEEACVALIRAHHLEDRVFFSSFNHCSMLYCKRIAPEIRTGLLFSKDLTEEQASLGLVEYTRRCGADLIHRRLSLEEVAQAHAAGLGVTACTVDDPAQMRAYLDAGVFSLITNRADILLDLIR